jgi:soluble P-type ATPase
MVGRVRNHCCHAKVTIRALFAVGVDVTVDSTDVFSVAMEMQKRIFIEQQNISSNN